MPILNYSTSIDYGKTVQEIQTLLSKRGANRIITDYENGRPVGISFQAQHLGQMIAFRLPANYTAVLKCLKSQKALPKAKQNEEQALRVCWRIIKDWVAAQMAIIEAEQASMATVFLPYAVMKNGDTVSDNLLGEKGKEFLLLN